jgi:hypothetical protein
MNIHGIASIKTSEHARRLLKIKACRGTHKSLRSQGRIPGAEARAARSAYAKARREAKELVERSGRTGNTVVDGTY